jgi:hypothetical protein
VPNRQHLINLLDLSLYVRNVSFFVLVLFYLRRCSVKLEYIEKDEKVVKITGPWKKAILYVIAGGRNGGGGPNSNPHYDAIFSKQFFDLKQHAALPLTDFIEVLCENFCRYQRVSTEESGSKKNGNNKKNVCQIVPTAKQKAFLERIIRAKECFHFSEVGSGKTKVILPLLCQTFLSGNREADELLARGGKVAKTALVVLVPEHLVPDALTQVHRYCLNLNFREEYRVHDDIFALLHETVTLGDNNNIHNNNGGPSSNGMKRIFVTSFNSFKKALTYDSICKKVWRNRERVLVVADEVDDFLDRDKLVFNICSNMGNSFDRPTLVRYYDVCAAAYKSSSDRLKSSTSTSSTSSSSGGGAAAAAASSSVPLPALSAVLASLSATIGDSPNPEYWEHLLAKFGAIHNEVQDASRSINKSFGKDVARLLVDFRRRYFCESVFIISWNEWAHLIRQNRPKS